MTPADSKRFIAAMVRTAEMLHHKLTDGQIAGYFEFFMDVPIDTLCAALDHVAKTEKWFPKPVELRALIRGISVTEDPDVAADRAWLRFRWALQHVPVYRSVTFDDPALHATIVALFGGWHKTGDILSHRMEFIRRDFLRTYLSHRAGKIAGHATLPGTHELENRGRFDWAIEPVVPVPPLAVPVEALTISDDRPMIVRGPSEPTPIGRLLPHHDS